MDKASSLLASVKDILLDQATEPPLSCPFWDQLQSGTYLCRRCGLALFRGDMQFVTSCGWPSFDVACDKSVGYRPDTDGLRTEIVCQGCDSHLGHVFNGEGYTATNQRYCVNGLSLDFVTDTRVLKTEEAVVAGGCFWGVESYLGRVPGVLKTEVGYTGGTVIDPTYKQVCSGLTGHAEALRIVFDADRCDYNTVLRSFFEIHDPTQMNQQGPDRGDQYRSAVFYYDDYQQTVVSELIMLLKQQGYAVVTQVLPVTTFWPAEDYHQQYYQKNGQVSYCHMPVQRFDKL
jgi:peptide methionine sulfoxide reductase msrA/msrB